jgi:hypothetical protein
MTTRKKRKGNEEKEQQGLRIRGKRTLGTVWMIKFWTMGAGTTE